MTLPVRTARPHEAACSPATALWRKPVVWLGLGAVVLAGLALNWNWLVAAGALPIFFGPVPCLAMCVFHLCSMRKSTVSKADGQFRAEC
jgi:hypothetical protein